MAFYEYLCAACGTFDSQTRGDRHACPRCHQPAVRQWGWNNASVLQSHFNPAFGCEISSRSQARELAKKASEDQSQRLGMTVNYELTDIHDHEAAGIDRAEAAEHAALSAEKSGRPVGV